MAIERTNPDTPCQPAGAHHPHRYECTAVDCCGPENYTTNGVGEYVWLGDEGLWCCIDGETWPCETKRAHVRERELARA